MTAFVIVVLIYTASMTGLAVLCAWTVVTDWARRLPRLERTPRPDAPIARGEAGPALTDADVARIIERGSVDVDERVLP